MNTRFERKWRILLLATADTFRCVLRLLKTNGRLRHFGGFMTFYSKRERRGEDEKWIRRETRLLGTSTRSFALRRKKVNELFFPPSLL